MTKAERWQIRIKKLTPRQLGNLRRKYLDVQGRVLPGVEVPFWLLYTGSKTHLPTFSKCKCRRGSEEPVILNWDLICARCREKLVASQAAFAPTPLLEVGPPIINWPSW